MWTLLTPAMCAASLIFNSSGSPVSAISRRYQTDATTVGVAYAPRVATFARGGGDQRLWARNQALIDGLSDNGAVEPERGRWVADPADAMALRGIPAVGPRGAPSAVRGSTPHRDAPSLR